MAVGLLLKGETRTFGWGAIARDRPSAPVAEAIFEIGSITKLFTALLLAQMVRTGELALDDPVQDYLPAGTILPVLGRPITLADLACHASGLPRLPAGLLRREELANPYAAFTAEDLRAAVGGARLQRPPGARVRYSNFGFGLLGNALAACASMSYEQLVRERICEPLGLLDTSMTVPAGNLERFAQGHDARGRAVSHWELPTLPGAGALRSTAADLLRFLAIHVSDDHSELIAAARLTHQPLAAGGSAASIGMGWNVVPFRGAWKMHCHEGATGGFQSFCGLLAEPRAAIVLLSNTARPLEKLGIRGLRALTDWWPPESASRVRGS